MNRRATARFATIAAALAAAALAACGRSAPALSAAVELAPASRAWRVAVADFLAPTPLGARDDTLCGWARGEATPANVARWVAEGRLRFRVLVADGAEARVAPARSVPAAGALAADLATLAEPEIALAARCGTPRPRAILVLADRAVSHGAVADAVELAREHGGYLDAWVAVNAPVTEERPAPGFQPGVPVVALVTPEARIALSNREGRGFEGPREALAAPLAAVGAPEEVGCATLSARPALPWAEALAAAEALRGAGVDLQFLDLEGAPGAALDTRAAVPARAASGWALDATLAAVPFRTASRCGTAPMGWWCDRACIPDLGEGVAPAAPAVADDGGRSLGELVYTAHRVVLVAEEGSGGERTEVLFDTGVLPARREVRGRPFTEPACAVAAARAAGLRHLRFEGWTESGVLRGAGAERGALTSLDPSFDATLAAVRDALAWRRAIATGTAPWDDVRAALDGPPGPRATLAWEALVNPAWHGGSVDAALLAGEGRVRAAPAALAVGDHCR